jgi:hypothetical protein
MPAGARHLSNGFQSASAIVRMIAAEAALGIEHIDTGIAIRRKSKFSERGFAVSQRR